MKITFHHFCHSAGARLHASLMRLSHPEGCKPQEKLNRQHPGDSNMTGWTRSDAE